MSIKILLADDSITIQKVIGIIFGGEEYSLTVVDNGKAAVEKAIEIVPDILLIDALMPGISGYEVCEQVRAIPALAAKPILLLTGSFEPFDEDKAKSCGADDFIAKPFESQQIISKVTELCELSASRSFETPQEEVLPITPPPLPEETETVAENVAVEEVETTSEPQDIWQAFTPVEPPADAVATVDDADQTAYQSEEAESTLWAPAEEQSSAFDDLTASDLTLEPGEETTYDAEPSFGESTLEGTFAPVASFAQQDEPETASETTTSVAPEVADEAAVSAPVTLTEEQLRAAIAGVSKDVIERIVWEVVPDLAETLIKEAIRRIKEGQ